MTESVHIIGTPYGDVEVYSRDPAFLVALTGRYFIQIVKERATNTTVMLMRQALADLAARHEKFGYVGLIEPHAQVSLPADVRAGFNTLVKRYSPHFTGAAIIYEKTGFHATAVRSVVTAINFASRAQHPNQVFADLREGLTWLGRLTPPEPTPSALVNIVQQLRAALPERS